MTSWYSVRSPARGQNLPHNGTKAATTSSASPGPGRKIKKPGTW
jgi:hypothetical protein